MRRKKQREGREGVEMEMRTERLGGKKIFDDGSSQGREREGR